MSLTREDGERLLRRYEAPAHPNLFFVGTYDRRITFYSQQVRALELVHALHLAQRLRPDDRIAVIGGGAAGLTAAMALRVLECRVELFEQSGELLQRQAGSQRMLDPRIYEWPRAGALDVAAELPLLTWSRGTADATRVTLLGAYGRLEAMMAPGQGPFALNTGMRIASAERVGGSWRLIPEGGEPQAFTKVILAVGFGEEQGVGSVAAQDYWSEAGPPQPTVMNARCLISGVGDGGLTDMMAILVANFEHRAFTEHFLNLVSAEELAAAVERAVAAAATPGGDLQAEYDAHVAPVLQAWGVPHGLAGRLHPDRTMVMNAETGGLLVPGEASKLNQVMAYALVMAARAQAADRLVVAGGRLLGAAPTGGGTIVDGPTLPDGGLAGAFDLVVVRHGTRRNAHLAWLNGKYEAFVTHRDALVVEDEESVSPPRLLDETYDFFHSALDRLYPAPEQLERAHTREQRRRLIILQVDRATRAIVERGALRLEEAISGSATGLEVHLIGDPADFGEFAPALGRALRCASPRVNVTSAGSDLQAWQSVAPWVAQRANPLPTPFSPVMAPAPEALAGLLEQVLLARLDQALGELWASGSCQELGPVHPTVRDAIRPVWTEWLQALRRDVGLRADVLRLLWKVEEDNQGWDGDLGCVPRLAAALVLMLASSLAVDGLAPKATGRPANLEFAFGFALGSGCRTKAGKNVDNCDDPNEWDADILMLSAATELEFQTAGYLDAAGGDPLRSLAGASRVAPALVKNNRRWRERLSGPAADWVAAVQAEWSEFRARQDEGVARL